MRLGPFKFASDFWTSKTTWAVIGGVVTAVGSAVSGEVTWSIAILTISGLLTGLFNRDTKAKAAEVDIAYKSTVMRLMTNRVPTVPLVDVLQAHGRVNRDAIAAAVAAAVTLALGLESKTKQGVEEIAHTGVDSGSAEAEVVALDEPEDGEADA